MSRRFCYVAARISSYTNSRYPFFVYSDRMAERNLVQELKRWATEEFNLPPDSLPSDSYFKTSVYDLTFLLFFSFTRCVGLVWRYGFSFDFLVSVWGQGSRYGNIWFNTFFSRSKCVAIFLVSSSSSFFLRYILPCAFFPPGMRELCVGIWSGILYDQPPKTSWLLGNI